MTALVCSDCHKKYHRLGGTTTNIYFLTVLESGSSRPKCQQVSVFGEGSKMAAHKPWLHGRERVNQLSGISSSKGTNPTSDQGPILMTSSIRDYLPKSSSPNTITLEGKASTYEFWESQTFSP